MTVHELTDARLVHRGHACLLYQDLSEQKAIVLPFIREGLRGGEYCFFISSDESAEDWALEFQAYGVDVTGEIASGALTMATGSQMREGPRFNSILAARDLWHLVSPKLVDFAGVRIAGDAGWAMIEPPLTAGQLCHWEATADLLYQGEAISTICMYDLNRHPPSDICAALRTHANVLAGGRRYSNPYYEASRILDNEPHLNASDADQGMVDDMLRQLGITPIS